MNIVFLTNEYASADLPGGGVGTFIKIIAAEISGKGHQVHVLGFSKKDLAFRDGDVQVVFRKSYFKRYPLLEIVRSVAHSLHWHAGMRFLRMREMKYVACVLKKFIAKHNIEIIESHAYNGFAACWDNSTPLVIRFHGSAGFDWKFRRRKKKPLRMYFEKKALLHTPYVIAVSEFSGRSIGEIYNIRLHPKIIYNGIDTAVFSKKADAAVIPESLFYFGTLSQAKGLPELCEVFNRIVPLFPNASLHLLGRGHEFFETTIAKLLSPEALARTTYYGEKELTEIPEIIQKAAVCVVPSLNETFGLVYVEAMAMEKIVVAANNDVVGEIITDKKNGFIANGTEDYVAIISKIFTQPSAYSDIAENGRKTVLEKFTKEVMTDKTVAYYRQMLADKSSSFE